ncbi:hypothetical protein FGO68_gene1657 [Halteria grandinella]|uniref:Uncharacterized protein n=1 Tax=Halteria grandinella TaxID=5974 RepID=A0A8J8SY60_HALGN|nr:hypothetical protein FGO68_gene1657 [Halteria grandinella]
MKCQQQEIVQLQLLMSKHQQPIPSDLQAYERGRAQLAQGFDLPPPSLDPTSANPTIELTSDPHAPSTNLHASGEPNKEYSFKDNSPERNTSVADLNTTNVCYKEKTLFFNCIEGQMKNGDIGKCQGYMDDMDLCQRDINKYMEKKKQSKS